MKTELTEINKLADDRLALQRQVLELKAKLDASTQAYALLASHRDRLAVALQGLDDTLQSAYLNGAVNVNTQSHCSISTARFTARLALEGIKARVALGGAQ